MKFAMLKHKEATFDGAMNALNKEQLAARSGCATSRWNRDEALSKLKVSETTLGESLNVLSERASEGYSMISKQFQTEATQGLKKSLSHFKYVAAEVFDGLKTSLLESTFAAQQEIANCVAMRTNSLASVHEFGTVKPYTSLLNSNAAAAGTAPSTSAGPSSNECPQ